ncbi:MAG: GSCFA domain-containing protein, partial [Bacteroidota bacterium]
RQVCEVHDGVSAFLNKASVVFVTFGSAWVYRHRKTGLDVGNCHKVAQSEFEKRLLSVTEITAVYRELVAALQQQYPQLRVVFTVSPVKHVRDGLLENLQSKSVLLLACMELARLRGISYFPAYELMTEDLRDYRFYEADMAHPNEQAVTYIWEKLSETIFSPVQQQLNTRISALRNRQEHRALFPDSGEHKEFVE